MKSYVLECLDNSDWGLEMLNEKQIQYQVIAELAKMEGYIKGLKEVNTILKDIIEKENKNEKLFSHYN